MSGRKAAKSRVVVGFGSAAAGLVAGGSSAAGTTVEVRGAGGVAEEGSVEEGSA